ncbi:MAG: SPOR domain-containing protein [Alphaproteobacteria bacterium]|nr:SPOR domain-containing protein [Alphaproteobacteria bacterium]
MTLDVDPEDRIRAAPPKPASGFQRHLGMIVRVGVVVVVLGAAGASSWHYLNEHFLTSAAPSGPLPVIGPDSAPIKEPPKQPGGMQVPDQDKIILNGVDARPTVEQILPPPPAPLPSPVSPPAQVQATPAPAAPPATIVAPAPSPSPSSSPAAAGAAASTPATASAPPPRTIEAPSPQPMAVAPQPPSLPAKTAPASQASPEAVASAEAVPSQLAGHGWFVQLGAVRSTAAAQAEWTRLKRAQSELLASLSANAVRVERGGAILYRIEAGPLADAGAAGRLCHSLEQRHVACIVLRP